MDDRAYTKSGIYLHTKGFNFNIVYKLVGILHYLFKINCTVKIHENKHVLYINAKSLTKI